MKILLAILLLALTACAHVGPTPDQLKAMDGLSQSMCFKSPGWNGSAVEVHVASFGGKATGTAGGGGKATCGASTVEFENAGRAPSATSTTTTTTPKGP